MAKPVLWLNCFVNGFTVEAPPGEPPLDVRRAMAALRSRVYVQSVTEEMAHGCAVWRVKLDPGFRRDWFERLIDGLQSRLSGFQISYRLGSSKIDRKQWVGIVLG